jgi:hypothetical protein
MPSAPSLSTRESVAHKERMVARVTLAVNARWYRAILAGISLEAGDVVTT